MKNTPSRSIVRLLERHGYVDDRCFIADYPERFLLYPATAKFHQSSPGASIPMGQGENVPPNIWTGGT